MRQPSPNKKISHKQVTPSTPPAVGMSGLERYFFENYLGRLGVHIVYQYAVDSIGRFFDFAIVNTLKDDGLIMEEKNGINAVSQNAQYTRPIAMIEVDGDYFHYNPSTNKRKMNGMQMKNKKADVIKNQWCKTNRIPILRLWESDIRNNAPLVIKKLNELLAEIEKKR